MQKTAVRLAILATVACSGGAGSRALIQNKGSDTMVNVAQAWAERYREVNPSVAVAVTGGGTGTGIAALINGTADLANASREMDASEIAAARANGVEPVRYVAGYDAIAVFLHPANPINEITLQQLADIYGDGGRVERWSDLGLQVPGCRGNEIVLVSRQNNSGTYEYFRDAVLGPEGEYKLGSRDLHGSKDVVELVQNTPCAIGYSGLAYATERVKMLCVSRETGAPCVPPTVSTAVDQSYPIARPLFLYSAGEPTGALRDYLDWILSDVGQCVIADQGYAPVREIDCRA